MAVKIIVDSVSDIPAELCKKYDIEVLPLTVVFENESFLDGVNISSAEFFDRLKKAPKLPTTSQVTPGMFMSTFEKHMANHDDVICLLMSSQMSGTYNAALTAKEALGATTIHVLDSKRVTFSIGLIAVEAAEMAFAGNSVESIIEKMTYKIDHQVDLYIVDTLEYLTKGGRLSMTEGFVGSMLNIKPILTCQDGKLKSIDKVRGRKKAIKWVIEYIKSKNVDLSKQRIGIYNADAKEYMKAFELELSQHFELNDVLYAEIGAVVGTHSGPGCVAISFVI